MKDALTLADFGIDENEGGGMLVLIELLDTTSRLGLDILGIPDGAVDGLPSLFGAE